MQKETQPRGESEFSAALCSASRATRKFCCSYRHDGATWALTIDAYDWRDAKSRVAKLGYLHLDGELKGATRYGWIARLMCWVRNAREEKRKSQTRRENL